MKEKETLFRKVDEDETVLQLFVSHESSGFESYVEPVTGYFFTEEEMAERDERAVEMANAIEYTIRAFNGYEKGNYEVMFMYPSNNIAFQKLLSALNKYKTAPSHPTK